MWHLSLQYVGGPSIPDHRSDPEDRAFSPAGPGEENRKTRERGPSAWAGHLLWVLRVVDQSVRDFSPERSRRWAWSPIARVSPRGAISGPRLHSEARPLLV